MKGVVENVIDFDATEEEEIATSEGGKSSSQLFFTFNWMSCTRRGVIFSSAGVDGGAMESL